MRNKERNQAVMTLKNINKTYYQNNKRIDVLNNISVDFFSGKFYVITGHSGSGKSTLINILGLIDSYDSGEYKLYGVNHTNYNDLELSKMRMEKIGFIFQDYYLDSNLKAYENVMLPMLINKKIAKRDRKKDAINLLTKVGLEDRVEHFPRQLSGGEQQRVSIARALANNPNIILADEPTGNLDEQTEIEIFKLLKNLSKEGKCIIVVSHSDCVKKYADVIYKIDQGKIVGDI